MKKVVNGKEVSVDVELFELAEAGKLRRDLGENSINGEVYSGVEGLVSAVTAYREIYYSFPYPLYAIEEPIKYVAILECLVGVNEEYSGKVAIKGNSLVIKLSDDCGVRFIGSTYDIVRDLSGFEFVDEYLDDYSEDSGYEEFLWCVNAILEDGDTTDFYEIFYPEFYDACGDIETLLRELKTMLNFHRVGATIAIEKGTLVDVGTDDIYRLEAYVKGIEESGLVETKDLDGEVYQMSGDLPLYWVNFYKKSPYLDSLGDALLDDSENVLYGEEEKLSKEEYAGLGSVFKQMIKAGTYDRSVTNVQARGIVRGDLVYYVLAGRLYQCKLREFMDSKEIVLMDTEGFEYFPDYLSIYSSDNEYLYLLIEGENRHDIVRLSYETGEIERCRTWFTAEDFDE